MMSDVSAKCYYSPNCAQFTHATSPIDFNGTTHLSEMSSIWAMFRLVCCTCYGSS